MRAVLYSDYDMEPITVIDVAPWAQKMLLAGERVNVVPPPMPLCSAAANNPSVLLELSYVTIWGEPLRRRNVETLMLFTANEEVALLLRSEFLPGQQKEVAANYRKGLVEGFTKAIIAMRGGNE